MYGSFALYEAFIKVYEFNGYCGAAKVVDSSKASSSPALKKGVAKLEKLFGVKLFVPTKKGVTPTPEGDYLYDSIKDLLVQFEQAENDIFNFTEESFFTVRVAIPSIFSTAQFISFIGDFCKKYVNAKIEFVTADCVEALTNRKVDFAISLKRDLIHAGFKVEDLYEDELVVLHKKELELMLPIDFDKLSLVVSKGMSKLFYSATGIELKPRLRVDTTEQIYSIVKCGVADCGLYWKTALNNTQLENEGLCAGDIGEIENIAPTETISCAYVEGKLHKGKKEFLKALQWHCKELKQPIELLNGNLSEF